MPVQEATPRSATRLPVLLALLTIYLLWGSTYLAIRVALTGFPPLLSAGSRHLCAGILLFAWLKLRGAPWPSRREWGGAALLGCLFLVGGNAAVVYAEQSVNSTITALFLATMPLWMALFQGMTGHWPRKLEWIGLALGFVGVALLNVQGDLRASPLGAGLLLLATISWSFGAIWSRRLTLPAGLMSAAAQMICGGVVILALGAVRGEALRPSVPWQAWAALVYLTLFGSIVAFSAFTYLLRKARPAIVSTYAFVNPVVALALGVGLAGEKLPPAGVAGTVIILLGVGVITFRKVFPKS